LYVNDLEEIPGNKFDVIFDDGDVLNVRGEVSYQSREKLRLSLRGDYYNYKMKNELRAWYKPQVEITLSGNYNLKDKIVVKADLFYIDSQFAKTVEKDPTGVEDDKVIAKELKGVFDANIGLEYRYTKKLGFFLNFNNIASQGYNRWYQYPTQRFGVMGGLSWSF
jgi:outer membrane receptor protein involved in Fe transport